MRFSILVGCWCLLVAYGCDSGGGDYGPTTEECSNACAKIAAADCGDIGSECVDRCVKQGSANYGDYCVDETIAYQSCFFSAVGYECLDDRTQPIGCDDERKLVQACVADATGGGAGPGGAANGGAASGGAANGGAASGGAAGSEG
jgi:hypothetical protein